MSAADEVLSQLTEALGEDFAGQVAEQVAQELGPTLKTYTPQEAVEKYFETRELTPGTKSTQKSSLKFFVHWCENEEIEDMSSLTGDDLADYRNWRRDESSDQVDQLKPKTEQTQQKITRTFIEFCESFDAVQPGLHEYVLVPSVDEEDEVRDQILDSESVADILSWLQKYEYASAEHVTVMLIAECGARLGGVHSLDIGDYIREENGGQLKFRHRPETETTLKNGKQGKRNTDISESVAEVLDDYVEDTREEVEDEYGREPLLATQHGRMAKSTIRNYVYAWTRPCAIGKGCPYDEDPEECKAARRNNWAFKCDGSLSCHPVRKGYITAELKAGVPKAVLSERCDVSERIMDKHYDYRTETEKMEARRVALRLAHESSDGYGK